jgi:hypothetical protein
VKKMTVNAKFKVQRVTPQSPISGKDGQLRDSAEIEMVPDYAGDRNKDWAEYTPSGVIRMNVNGPALSQFVQGKAFTVTFEEDYSESGGAKLSGEGVQRVGLTDHRG